jgi:hypothetical protein
MTEPVIEVKTEHGSSYRLRYNSALLAGGWMIYVNGAWHHIFLVMDGQDPIPLKRLGAPDGLKELLGKQISFAKEYKVVKEGEQNMQGQTSRVVEILMHLV